MDNREMKTILKLIELKQEEGFLKWLFMPFWMALTATVIFIAFLFIGSGSFFSVIPLTPIIAFGIYMSRRSHNRLKEIKKDNLNVAYLK